MKILFALNQNKELTVEENLLKYYKSITDKEFSILKEYDLSGVSHKFKFEKFDLLILNEELERDNPVTTTFIDDLTDKFASSRIVLIINSEHKSDTYVKRLFNLGVYDLLYSNDITIESIVGLIIKPRTKAEAKIYLNLHDIDDVKVESELRYIPEDELENILNYFDTIESSIVESTFEHLYNQYNQDQMIFLIKHLSTDILNLLVNNLLYQELKELIDNRNNLDDYEADDILEDKPPSISGKVTDKIKDSFSQGRENKPVKIKERVEYKEKIIKEKEYVHIKPDDYMKFAGFVGAKGKGKTLIIDLIARFLSDNGVEVSVVDTTQSNNFYYKYIWGNDSAKDKNKKSITNLVEGEFTPYKVKKDYNLYAEADIPNTLDVLAIVDRLKTTSKVILIDMDFNSNFVDMSKYILNNIFIVHDLNILDIRHTKSSLLKLISSNVNPLKFSFLINKYIKSSVTERTIMEMLENPINEIEKEEQACYLKFKENPIFTLRFDKELYASDINSSYLPEKDLSFSEDVRDDIYAIANYIYPLPSGGTKQSIFKKIFK